MYGRIVDCRFNFGCRFFIRCLVPGLLTLATNDYWYPLEIRYLEISFLQACSFVGYLLVFLSHRLSQLPKTSAVSWGSLHVIPLWNAKYSVQALLLYGLWLVNLWWATTKRITRTQGGLAMAFDLAAFRLSMIAPVTKSVNHSRTVASMRETGWEQQQEVRLRRDSIVWNEFAYGPVGHCFLCCN